MSRFTPIPAPPVFGAQEWEVRTLNAMKQNIDLLTGLRNEADLSSKAILTSTFGLSVSDAKVLDSIAPSSSYTLSTGTSVNNLGQVFGVLINDAQLDKLLSAIRGGVAATDLDTLRQDIAALRTSLNNIISVLTALR